MDQPKEKVRSCSLDETSWEKFRCDSGQKQLQKAMMKGLCDLAAGALKTTGLHGVHNMFATCKMTQNISQWKQCISASENLGKRLTLRTVATLYIHSNVCFCVFIRWIIWTLLLNLPRPCDHGLGLRLAKMWCRFSPFDTLWWFFILGRFAFWSFVLRTWILWLQWRRVQENDRFCSSSLGNQTHPRDTSRSGACSQSSIISDKTKERRIVTGLRQKIFAACSIEVLQLQLFHCSAPLAWEPKTHCVLFASTHWRVISQNLVCNSQHWCNNFRTTEIEDMAMATAGVRQVSRHFHFWLTTIVSPTSQRIWKDSWWIQGDFSWLFCCQSFVLTGVATTATSNPSCTRPGIGGSGGSGGSRRSFGVRGRRRRGVGLRRRWTCRWFEVRWSWATQGGKEASAGAPEASAAGARTFQTARDGDFSSGGLPYIFFYFVNSSPFVPELLQQLLLYALLWISNQLCSSTF